MYKTIKSFLLVLCLLPLAACAEDGNKTNFKEGVDYITLTTPVSVDVADKIEVVELFSYGCPHCHEFEEPLNKWLTTLPKDVNFVRVPAIFSKPWETLAKAYYSADILEISDKAHTAIFKAIHDDKQDLSTENNLTDFFTQFGIDKKEFYSTFHSFGVDSSIRQAKAKLRGYRASGVPTVIVNGKYRIDLRSAGDHDNLFAIVDFLIDKERNLK